ncbi:hypothetical protein CHL78_012050 [Romboutsia weinsteinii]|uniref:Uncharacterized protein n=1 Tax=Romboutsia weinsteinii TaxID=2020949 RepID=A0A371J2A7_9FIRM|nr:hypothetical protein [Romboutsia weinsteinii]RDY26796.1 hypothetical protein CHL78_012050 [Romboutsia weinsteinii]
METKKLDLQRKYKFDLNIRHNGGLHCPPRDMDFYQNDTLACIMEIGLYNDTTNAPINLASYDSIYIGINYGKWLLELTNENFVYNGNKLVITLPSYCIENAGSHLVQITLYGGRTLTFPSFGYLVRSTMDGVALTKTNKLNYMQEILSKQKNYQNNLDENYYTSKEVDEKVKEAQGINPDDYALKNHEHSEYAMAEHEHENYADKEHTHNYMTFYENPVGGTKFKNGDTICRDVEIGGTN